MNDVENTPGVLAVVPLFHPTDGGVGCLQAILRQEGVFVDCLFVDNSAFKAAKKNQASLFAFLGSQGWAHQQQGAWRHKDGSRFSLLQDPSNPGPGSVFAQGMGKLDPSRHAYVWFLDQDMRPQPDCLRELA